MIPTAKNPKAAKKPKHIPGEPHRKKSKFLGKKRAELPTGSKRVDTKEAIRLAAEEAEQLDGTKRFCSPAWVKFVHRFVSKSPLYNELKIEQVAVAMFMALPMDERGTFEKLALDWPGVSIVALRQYRLDPNVSKLRFMLMKHILKEKTSEVFDSIYRAATTKDDFGKWNVSAMKLWMQIVEDYSEHLKVDPGEGIMVSFSVGKSPFMAGPEESDTEANQQATEAIKAAQAATKKGRAKEEPSDESDSEE